MPEPNEQTERNYRLGTEDRLKLMVYALRSSEDSSGATGPEWADRYKQMVDLILDHRPEPDD